MGGLCSWDAEMDGTVTIKWDNEGIICVLNVYGIAVWAQKNFKHILYLIYSQILFLFKGNIVIVLILVVRMF